jgi:hypothetical protein
MKRLANFLFIILISCSCSQNKVKKESIKESHAKVNSTVIDESLIDSIELELSDISENFQLIKLETSKSVLLGNIYTIVLGENYLVIGTERDYYLFDRKGKYIRRLLIIGRGPAEFIMPQFSKVIKDDILYISDSQKNRKYIYSIELKTGKQNRILKAKEGIIQSFIPDSDSTFLIIYSNSSIVEKSFFSISLESYLIRQNFNGKPLNEIALGITKGFGPFLPSGYTIFANNGDILIESPRCDSILRYSDSQLLTIWRNIYSGNFNENLTIQKVPEANLIHYAEDSLLFWKSDHEYTIINKSARGRSGKVQFVLMDRINNRLIAVKKLTFLDKTKPINIARFNLLDNDQFAMVLQAEDVDQMLKIPQLKESLKRILIPDSTGLTIPISAYDNPFILIGKFE